MAAIGILNFPCFRRQDTLKAGFEVCDSHFHEDPHPEVHTNYIDRHRYVDTNYVSSGGRDRMK